MTFQAQLNNLLCYDSSAPAASKHTAPLDTLRQCSAHQVSRNVLIKVEAGLFTGCFVEEQRQLAAPFANVAQVHAARSTCHCCVGCRILPKLLLLEQTTM